MERIFTPIKFSKTMERMMKIRPEMAELISSLPSFSLSGLPAEVVTIKVP